MPARFRGSLAGTALETFVLRSFVFVLGVAVNIVVSRGLGPGGRGEYVLTTLSALTIVALGKLGLEHTNVYLLGTKRMAPSRIAAQNVVVAAVAGVVGFSVLVGAPMLLPSIYATTDRANLALAALTVPILLHTQLAAGLQNLLHVVTWQFRAALAGAALQLAAVGTLIVLGRLDVTTALVAYLAGSLLTWLMVLSRSTRPLTAPFLDLAVLRLTLRYSLVVHVGLVLLFLQTRLTLFLVQAFLGAAELGLYSLAVSISESVLLAADSLAIALLPRQTETTLADSAATGLRGARYGAALAIAGAAPLAAFGAFIVPFVFGQEFAPSYLPLVVLLPGAVFFAVQRFCGVPALRANRPSLIAAIYAAGVAANVLLDVWWIPRVGLVGAAAATTCSYLLTAVLFLWWARVIRDRGRMVPLNAYSRSDDDV